MIENLTEATPAEIDTELSKLWIERDKADRSLSVMVGLLHRMAGDKGERIGRYTRHSLSWERVLEKLVLAAMAPETEVAYRHSTEVNRALTNWATTVKQIGRLDAEIKVCNDEFSRRGGWTRAFLVQGANGHVHSSRACSTCNKGESFTSFVWMYDYSGKDETEIVEAAGERACTVCYPSAPVEVLSRPSKMFGPDEIEAQKAKVERDAKAAAKKARAAANAITDVDGETLYEKPATYRHRGDKITTLSAAKQRITDNIQYIQWGWNNAQEYHDSATHLAQAIAAKEGKTSEQVIAEATKRAKNRK